MVTQYDIHPYAKLFPMMSDDEYVAFRSDIETNGLRNPLVLYQGKILDGRNRYRCCTDLGIEPTTQPFTGEDALAYVLSLNLYRRQLSVAQRALIAAEVSSLKVDNPVGSLSIDEAATIMGVSPRSISSASKVVREGVPELVEAVKAGGLSISAAERVSNLEEEKQRELCCDGPKALTLAAKKLRDTSKPKGASKSVPVVPAESVPQAPQIVQANSSLSAVDSDLPPDDIPWDSPKKSSTEILLRLAQDAMEQGYEAETLVGQILDEVEQGLDMQLLLFTSEAMSLLYPRLKAMSYRR